MGDRKPPRVAGDERDTLLALLQFQRASVLRKVAGLDEAAAGASPVASGTSLTWLVGHLSFAERVWVLHRFAGQDLGAAGVEVAVPDLQAAVDRYRETWALVDEVIAASPDLEAPCAIVDAQPGVNLRWVLMHLLEETARHAGHADILRELIDGDVGR